MVKKLAGSEYSEQALLLFAERFGRGTKCSEFIRNFPSIDLGSRTIKKIHRLCVEYLDEPSNTARSIERFEELKNVASISVFKIIRCLDMGAHTYSSLPHLHRLMGGKPSSISFLANTQTTELVGDYMYCRPSPSKTIDKGGMRFFLQYGYPRFVHYYDIADLLEVRKKEGLKRNNQTDSADPYVEKLRRVTRIDFGAYDGAGFFYANGGQLTVLSLHPADVRCSLGKPLNSSELKVKHIELTVAGRAKNGSHFAAKAIMFHHSHDMFGKPKSVTKKVLADHLGVDDYRKALLSF